MITTASLSSSSSNFTTFQFLNRLPHVRENQDFDIILEMLTIQQNLIPNSSISNRSAK
jgi:hypothetical protein